ncbi:nicotinamidase/pyrazinamidase [Moraxella cuniculi DSM 21768]|uniref:nicotinamidase n=1 Tax=Moraxella cuniculi DSM 21768 TaxID=1122245 RepID=A0A1N7F1K4_9GAMM|nr:nicotinamidase [Moraxella cuniculi]SIR94238.1 nicotinamidase/pyrazinamidase [Moraxella cuniculi DSM 21768]
MQNLSIEQNRTALIVVDVQNGFITGNLAVLGADKIIPLINQLARQFHHVILTQDYHPANHISFFDNHVDKQPFESIRLPYGEQILWPRHCVQGTADADFHQDLDITHAELIIRKGYQQAVDSYSAFVEADGTYTGLAGYLQQRGIDTLYLVGIATDYCVAWTAMDAVKLGFDCTVVQEATAAIDKDGSLQVAMRQMQHLGVKII